MRLGDLPIFIIDTETTGLKASEDTLCEVALIRWLPPNYSGNLKKIEWSSLVNPGRQIQKNASDIHGITDDAVIGAPSVSEVRSTIHRLIPCDSLVLAHNMPFDSQFLQLDNRHLGCTLRLARHVWPQAPSFKNKLLAEWLGIAMPEARLHRALNDAKLTAQIFHKILLSLVDKNGTLPLADELISLSSILSPITTMPFGKYQGAPLNQVPKDYLQYAITKWTDAEPALLQAIKIEIKAR
jgi:exodeoxyribonuclease X